MIIDLIRLNNDIINNIDINEKISFTKEELQNTGLLKLDDVLVNGKITKNNIGYILQLNISGTMQLSCAITLEPVNYPFMIEINDELSNLIGENEEIVKKSTNAIDILPIIWENILVEIPMKVTSDNAHNQKYEGVGWRLLSEEDKTNNINPELEKLKELYEKEV